MGCHTGVAIAASAMNFKNCVIGCKARPFGQACYAMCEFGGNVLGHVATIIAYRINMGFMFMTPAADRPCIQGFDPVHLTCIKQFIQRAIDGCRRRDPF